MKTSWRRDSSGCGAASEAGVKPERGPPENFNVNGSGVMGVGPEEIKEVSCDE